MAGKALLIEEQSAAEDYRRVSRESQDEAKKLHLGFSAVYALLDPALATREEILSRIQRLNGDVVDGSNEAIANLGHNLGETLEHLGSLSTRASSMASDATRTAEQIERTGLPL
jgi:hypothetical protein